MIMGGRASKAKGATGEREFCKILESHLGGHFVRTPSSGAFIGGVNISRMEQLSVNQIRTFKGDIYPDDAFPRLVVEVKNYKDFPFHNLMSDDPLPILDGKDGWITQTTHNLNQDDFWLLGFKITRKGWYVAFDQKHLPNFNLTTYVKRQFYIVTELLPFISKNVEEIKKLSV